MLWRKKKTYVSTGSLSSLAWKRFQKNALGMASLATIALTFLIAMLGYLITPDSTPFANKQILEIGTQKPGFSVAMLLVRKNEPSNKKGPLSKMLSGEKSDYNEIPISDYQITGRHVQVKTFEPEGYGLDESFAITDVLFNTSDIPVEGEFNESEVSVLKSDHLIHRKYWLGTDQFGRDLLSRLIIGTRVSLSVGLISVMISLIVGIFLGSLAGFFGGRTDDVITWFINVVWSIPTLLLVIAITFALGRGFWQIFVAVGLTMWVEVARVVRGQIISLREKEFIEAGKALGFSDFRIISKHILPNIMSPVIVISAANFAAAILIEAGLSFLGIGVQPPMPSWGSMIKEYYSFIILDSAYLAIVPGTAIVILVLAFMTLGNTLRDALDVKIETARE
jgi:peptide/nickel transport system permease protein